MYDFKPDVYSSNMNYNNAFSAYQFFSTPEQTKEFLLFLVYRLDEEYLKRKTDYSFCFLAHIDNNRASTIDIEYNFFISVLGEWISFYSIDDEILHEYTIYFNFEETGSDDETIEVRKERNIKILFTVQEKVQFDYGFVSWLTKDKFHKKSRALFLNNFLNKFVFSNLVWIDYKNKYPTIIYNRLLEDTKFDIPVEYKGLQLNRMTLAKHIGNKRVDRMMKMTEDYEKITSQNIHVNNRIKKFNEQGIEVKYYQNFDIERIQKERDLNNNSWKLVGNSESEESDV